MCDSDCCSCVGASASNAGAHSRCQHLFEIESAFQIPEEEIIWTSAKTGEGVDEILDALIKYIPSPGESYSDNAKKESFQLDGSLRAIVVDSWHNNYRGVIVLMSVVDGD